MAEVLHPLVSILTPTYNRADLLIETIDSVLGQTYPNIEYVVLDDGSTDNTRQVLERYRGRLIWDVHPNMGETRTVNRGWNMLHGEYIMVVNSDDPILPHTVETMVRFMEDHPELLMAYPYWFIIDEKSRVVGENCSWDYNFLNMLRYAACFPGPAAMLRRKGLTLESARDTRYKYVADFEYWLRLGLHGPCARIPEYLATHRIHPDSAQVKVNSQVGGELIQLMSEFFSRPGLPSEVRAVRRQGLSSAYYDAGKRSLDFSYFLASKFFFKALLLRPRLRYTHHFEASLQKILYLLIYLPIQKTPLRPILFPLKLSRHVWHFIRHLFSSV